MNWRKKSKRLVTLFMPEKYLFYRLPGFIFKTTFDISAHSMLIIKTYTLLLNDFAHLHTCFYRKLSYKSGKKKVVKNSTITRGIVEKREKCLRRSIYFTSTKVTEHLLCSKQ